MVSSKDTVSEQVVQARQTRRRRAGFWVRLVLAGRQAGSREWSQQQAVTLNVTGVGTGELLYLTGRLLLRPQHRRATCKAPGRFSLRAGNTAGEGLGE